MSLTLAIVIGLGSYNDLGLIRSCGEAKIKSIYLIHSSSIVVPIYKSKYVKYYKFIDLLKLKEVLHDIELAHPGFKFLLLGASDAAVLQIEKLTMQLSKVFITSRIDNSFRYNMRKDVMAEMAQKVGLATPWTTNIDLKNNVQIPLTLYPIILKPSNSVEGNKSDITICHTPQDLDQAIKLLKQKGYNEILAQQYLHNEESMEVGITGVSYGNRDIEIHGIIEKIRNRYNINNFGKYRPKMELPIIDQLKEYIRATGYVGIFDTDFIRYNGDYYFIECNFRNGAYGYSVTSGGFNMCGEWAKSEGLQGIILKRKRLKDITFMEERTDVLNVFDKTMSIHLWLRDVFKTNTFLWWNWRDPMPTIYHYINKFRRKLKK